MAYLDKKEKLHHYLILKTILLIYMKNENTIVKIILLNNKFDILNDIL